MVELHIAGATLLWIVTLRLWLATVERPEPTPSSPALAAPDGLVDVSVQARHG